MLKSHLEMFHSLFEKDTMSSIEKFAHLSISQIKGVVEKEVQRALRKQLKNKETSRSTNRIPKQNSENSYNNNNNNNNRGGIGLGLTPKRKQLFK